MATHAETHFLAEFEAALGRALLVRAAARVMLALNKPVSATMLCDTVSGLDIDDGFGNRTWLAREILDFLEIQGMAKRIPSRGRSKLYEATSGIEWVFEEMDGSYWIRDPKRRGFPDRRLERLNHLTNVDLSGVTEWRGW